MFIEHLSPYILPTLFYEERAINGLDQYHIITPWLSNVVQYKEAVANNRHIPAWQLPPLEVRLDFINRFSTLLQDGRVYPRITDLDFFLVDGYAASQIKIIDTNFFWFPKGVNDRRKVHYQIFNFLFRDEELRTAGVVSVAQLLNEALNVEQLD